MGNLAGNHGLHPMQGYTIHGISGTSKHFVSRNSQAAPVSCRGAGEFVFITSHGHGIAGTVENLKPLDSSQMPTNNAIVSTNICSLPVTEVTQATPCVSSKRKDRSRKMIPSSPSLLLTFLLSYFLNSFPSVGTILPSKSPPSFDATTSIRLSTLKFTQRATHFGHLQALRRASQLHTSANELLNIYTAAGVHIDQKEESPNVILGQTGWLTLYPRSPLSSSFNQGFPKRGAMVAISCSSGDLAMLSLMIHDFGKNSCTPQLPPAKNTAQSTLAHSPSNG